VYGYTYSIFNNGPQILITNWAMHQTNDMLHTLSYLFFRKALHACS